MENIDILNINDLKVSYRNDKGFVQVLRGVDIALKKQEILGIIGESGSGKTVTASTVLRLTDDDSIRIDSGSIKFSDMELINLPEKDMRKIRGKRISYIFQDAGAALNPYRRVGVQLKEVLKVHKEKVSMDRILTALTKAGIENAEVICNMYPWQLSGGLCQRAVIAMSTIFSPEIIIADEPTTAIDASLQKKVLDLLKDINEEDKASIIIITHDFDVVRYICNRVIVMYGGLVMEEGTSHQVLNHPLHPYTKELIHCAESLDDNEENLYSLEGAAPSPEEFKDQCPFYERCRQRCTKCSSKMPEIKYIDNRKVRCILAEGDDTIEN